MIVEYDHDWASKIRTRRFRMHNADWLRAVLQEGPVEDAFEEGGGGDDESEFQQQYDHDDDDPHHPHAHHQRRQHQQQQFNPYDEV